MRRVSCFKRGERVASRASRTRVDVVVGGGRPSVAVNAFETQRRPCVDMLGADDDVALLFGFEGEVGQGERLCGFLILLAAFEAPGTSAKPLRADPELMPFGAEDGENQTAGAIARNRNYGCPAAADTSGSRVSAGCGSTPAA